MSSCWLCTKCVYSDISIYYGLLNAIMFQIAFKRFHTPLLLSMLHIFTTVCPLEKHDYIGLMSSYVKLYFSCLNHGTSKIYNYTGWPVKHGRIYLVPCKKWLVQCTLLYTCTLDSLLLTRYQIHQKLVTLYDTLYIEDLNRYINT